MSASEQSIRKLERSIARFQEHVETVMTRAVRGLRVVDCMKCGEVKPVPGRCPSCGYTTAPFNAPGWDGYGGYPFTSPRRRFDGTRRDPDGRFRP